MDCLLKCPQFITGVGEKQDGRKDIYPGLKPTEDLIYNHITLSQKTTILLGSKYLKEH